MGLKVKYAEFAQLVGESRMNGYLVASKNDVEKAMLLYRLNIRIGQNMFAMISFFEVILRNQIDKHYREQMGKHWISESIKTGGVFSDPAKYEKMIDSIREKYDDLITRGCYSPDMLLSSLTMGTWACLFRKAQFYDSGGTLHNVFRMIPGRSSFGYKEIERTRVMLEKRIRLVNDLRNSIAHHSPVVFQSGATRVSVKKIEADYDRIVNLIGLLCPHNIQYGFKGMNRNIKAIISLKLDDEYTPTPPPNNNSSGLFGPDGILGP